MLERIVSRYRKIDTRIWTDSKFNELSPIKPSGQALFLYLLTARESTMLPGLMCVSEAGLAERLGWSMRAFRTAWREIESQKMAEADWKRQLVWLPNAIKYNEPANPNVVKGWFKHFDELPECELRDVALRYLYDFILTRSSEFRKAFRKAFGKPLLNGLLKQEQEQEQEQSISSPSTELDTSSGAPATFKPGDEEDRVDMTRGEGGVEPQGRGEFTVYPESTPELPPGIPSLDEVTTAVEQVEASAWMPVEPPQQPVDAVTKPNPTQQPGEPPIGRDGEPRGEGGVESQDAGRTPRRDAERNPDKCPPGKGSEPGSHNGCSVPLGGRKPLDELAEYDSLNGGSVEYYVHASGVGGAPPLGSAGLRRLARLTPIMAWELRQALAAARATHITRSADGYLASCIEGYRRDGARPAPRALPEPEAPPACRESTDRQVLRHNRRLWAEAIQRHGLPLNVSRLDDLERRGPPDNESDEQLANSLGNWTEFDRLGGEMKGEAMQEVFRWLGRVPGCSETEQGASAST